MNGAHFKCLFCNAQLSHHGITSGGSEICYPCWVVGIGSRIEIKIEKYTNLVSSYTLILGNNNLIYFNTDSFGTEIDKIIRKSYPTDHYLSPLLSLEKFFPYVPNIEHYTKLVNRLLNLKTFS